MLIVVIVITECSCQKTSMVPNVSGATAFTVVNAVPNTVNGIAPIINTSQAIMWFGYIYPIIGYGNFQEYSPVGGMDTVYTVQYNSQDTLDVGPKATGKIFYSILNLEKGGIYTLFLSGSDTTSPDYLFIKDSVPYYPTSDSVMGIRFVNLSTGSGPISINLEGSPNGSEVSSLTYKGITGFKQYPNNSTTLDYFFVIRDAATGDSLTQFDFNLVGDTNNGYGLADFQYTGDLLTFKNITIALIGQPGLNAVVPQSTMIINNF